MVHFIDLCENINCKHTLNVDVLVQQSKQQRGTEDHCGELSGSASYQDEREESSYVCGRFSQVSLQEMCNDDI